MLSILISFLLPQAFALHVVIDAGHGGIDHGTSKADFKESEVALDVAKRLASKLRKKPGFKVTLTRDSDHQVGLLDRAKIADKVRGDVMISIHVNSSPDPKAKGAEFYFQNQLAADEESMFLAHRENSEPAEAASKVDLPVLQGTAPAVRTILEDLLNADRISQSSELCKFLKKSWRGHHKHVENSLYQAPFVVVSETHMPAALVELGFATNADDYKALTDTKYLDLAAQSLVDGLTSFKESMDKHFPRALKSPQVSNQ
jgi:N-acetylmuramoyl-L-alanine amidase